MRAVCQWSANAVADSTPRDTAVNERAEREQRGERARVCRRGRAVGWTCLSEVVEEGLGEHGNFDGELDDGDRVHRHLQSNGGRRHCAVSLSPAARECTEWPSGAAPKNSLKSGDMGINVPKHASLGPTGP